MLEMNWNVERPHSGILALDDFAGAYKYLQGQDVLAPGARDDAEQIRHKSVQRGRQMFCSARPRDFVLRVLGYEFQFDHVNGARLRNGRATWPEV